MNHHVRTIPSTTTTSTRTRTTTQNGLLGSSGGLSDSSLFHDHHYYYNTNKYDTTTMQDRWLQEEEEEEQVLDNDCPLLCQNGGVCKTIANEMRVCDCPFGFTGKQCEQINAPCFKHDARNYYCRYGSPCSAISDNHLLSRGGSNSSGKTSIYCKCTEAYTVSAGHECEYPATTYCTNDGSVSNLYFCTNGGTCDSLVDPKQLQLSTNSHFAASAATTGATTGASCTCPNRYNGKHCQYHVDHPLSVFLSSHGTDSTTNHVVFIIMLVVFVMSLATLLFLLPKFVLSYRQALQQRDDATALQPTIPVSSIANDSFSLHANATISTSRSMDNNNITEGSALNQQQQQQQQHHYPNETTPTENVMVL